MGQIDSTAFRLDPEVKREAWYYAHTGGLVDDPEWNSLSRLYRHDPAKFAADHPNIVGYFSPPTLLGMQPHGPILDDLRHRYEVDPARFTRYHNFWGEIFSLEPLSSPQPPGVPPVLTPPVTTPGGTLPPPAGQGAVPEPSSCVLMGIAMIFLFLAMWRRGRC
jgi:hypothetical protein